MSTAARLKAISVEHEGRIFDIALKRVASARRFTLRVRASRGDVVLTLPPSASPKAARAFASQHAAWVAERLGRLSARLPFMAGQVVPVRGTPHRIVLQPGLRRRAWLEGGSDGDMSLLCVSGPAGDTGNTVLAFLQGEARRDLADAVARYASKVGKTVTGLVVRDTKSRWGSCSSRGTLNFSWRLIMAPPFVLDYLAAHEVGHLVHMNHSAQFWAVVKELAPRLPDAEAWLKAQGPGLHLYGP